MSFYDKLQLDPYAIKQLIHTNNSASERRKLFFVMFFRSVLLVSFAIVFISVINLLFGAENQYLAVVLFCMLLSIRFIHFGYKLSQSIVGLGLILGAFFLIPLVMQVNSIFWKFIFNFLLLGMILLLTSDNPKMGNPGLYSFSYVFLSGTSIQLNQTQLINRGSLLGLFFILFSILFVIKHGQKHIKRSLQNTLFEKGILNKKNLWLMYYVLGISLILVLGYLIDIKRYMWVGIAFSSLISIYELPDIKSRFVDRLVGVVVGSILFIVLAQMIPASLLGILGGIALGLCTTYRFKNIFNCFGALALATTLFGNSQAVILRISNNLLGLLLGFVYLLVGRMIYERIFIKGI